MSTEDAIAEPLLVEDVGRVRILTFNRPRRANAFDAALYLAAATALDVATSDDGVSAVVLTGAGSSFSAGTDLVEMANTVAA
nr:enoyl-CoA hydratase-related protein [Micromonospora sp. DSM 115978]